MISNQFRVERCRPSRISNRIPHLRLNQHRVHKHSTGCLYHALIGLLNTSMLWVRDQMCEMSAAGSRLDDLSRCGAQKDGE